MSKLEGEQQRALQDIEYIKGLLARNERKLGEASPFMYVWGAYLTVGFIGMHFDQKEWPIWYWGIAAVICGAISGIIGSRMMKTQRGGEGGFSTWMYVLPFAAMFAAGSFMLLTNMINTDYTALFWTILIALSYIAMGSMAGKGPVYLGLWFIVLAIVTRLILLDYQYIVLGVFGGGSIIVFGYLLQQRRKRNG
ncbi:hypothetical protein [Paenibacillus sp. 2TAB19]|uniref:hypothetical protein n=1 Tax=Paenibacillus sp. 2TAB19 TaxID=3233003 RepID=UPI003F951074